VAIQDKNIPQKFLREFGKVTHPYYITSKVIACYDWVVPRWMLGDVYNVPGGDIVVVVYCMN